jgi:hypothetical protein
MDRCDTQHVFTILVSLQERVKDRVRKAGNKTTPQGVEELRATSRRHLLTRPR